MRSACCTLVAVMACVSAPSRIDTNALVKKLGPDVARHELEVRIVDDEKDIQARLALAKLCDEQGRPSQALEQLEVVLRIGGPLGTRWHDDDRARFGRLLAARGRARIARGAPTALGDFVRAKEYGAKVGDDEVVRAKLANAIVRLRHVDAKERAAGYELLRGLGTSRVALIDMASAPSEAAWRGVATKDGEYGAWLWSVGAKRAAWDALSEWHASAGRTTDDRLQSIYLAAYAWWTPLDGASPSASDLVGPERCRFGGCSPWELVQNAPSSDAIAALVAAPPQKTSDPEAAYAWLAITLAQSLRGEGAWSALFAARVDTKAISVDRMPPGGRGAFALVTGGEVKPDDSDRSPPGRYLAAAVAASRGANVKYVLGPLFDTPDGAALGEVVAPTPADAIATPLAAAVTRFIHTRLGLAEKPADRARAAAILDAYKRDPTSGDRIARDAIAKLPDGALANAWVGALFDAIEDPARARASWQAAVDAGSEPLFVRGLAEAIARANDPDAAIVIGMQAAAASGDPAPVWIAICDGLLGVGATTHALEAARYAMDLASADTMARAVELAIAASEAAGRTYQASTLRTQRAKLAPPITVTTSDPFDPTGALAGKDADRMWTVSRWNPRDVPLRVALLDALTDVRRVNVIAELVELAADRDLARARAAIRALRKL